MSTSNQTHNHQTIRQWAEARKGIPARVIGTALNDEEGTLKIHFPDFGKTHELQEISWEDFFNNFEKEELDFLYQEQKANGKLSTFYQLVARLGSGPRVPTLKDKELT